MNPLQVKADTHLVYIRLGNTNLVLTIWEARELQETLNALLPASRNDTPHPALTS